MINALAQPSVCVVDNEEEDYGPLLSALNDLNIGCVHFKGDNVAELPEAPWSSVRLVFQDLHLTADTGKNAASHAANVFRKIVSKDTAPVVVVIWSKYAADPVADGKIPAEEQKSEAELFRDTLQAAEPAFAERLVYIEMSKPKQGDRPEDWVEQLRHDIATHLEQKKSVGALLQWESMVCAAGVGISSELTLIAQRATAGGEASLSDGLRIAMQVLARSHAEGTLSPANAPSHLNSALAQLLVDHLEHASVDDLVVHGEWLAQGAPDNVPAGVSPRLNSLFLTSHSNPQGAPFLPGTVYAVTQPDQFTATFGQDVDCLKLTCSSLSHKSPDWGAWKAQTRPVLVELSPTCDVANNKRYTAILLAGLVVPATLENRICKRGPCWSLPSFGLRWPRDDFAVQDASLVFCSRFQATLRQDSKPTWMAPWFRLRELPTSALRNWQAATASRVGYVSAGT